MRDLQAARSSTVPEADASIVTASNLPSWRTVATKLAIGYASVSLLLVGLGLLVVHPFRRSGLVKWDEHAVEWFAGHRTSRLSGLSSFWSKSADAPTIVVVALLVAVLLALRRHRREIFLVAVILAVELGTFLTISYSVGRARPNVQHLGSVPSTGSFPSGHIAATIVLYGFVTLLLYRFGAPRPLRWFATVWAAFAAIAVGWARMYRGMHHPLDVAAGAVMGIGVLAAAAWALQKTGD